MKKSVIALIALVLIGLGVYVVNALAGNAAAREIDALLAPKFEDAGTRYSGLSVNPAGGALTLYDVATEGGEIKVAEITITSNYEDILAAAQGVPDVLHGLGVQVEDVVMSPEPGEEIRMEQAAFHVDGDIDLQALSSQPESWMLEFLSQDEAHVSARGSGWTLLGSDLTEDFPTGTNRIQFDDFSMDFNKENGSLDVEMEWDSPEMGSMVLDVDGNEDQLENFEVTFENLDLAPDDDVRIQADRAAFSTSGRIPMDEVFNFNVRPNDLFETGMAIDWSVHLRDFMMTSPDLIDEGIPSDRISFEAFDHEFHYTVDKLETTFDFEGNLGSGEVDIDWDITSFEPPAGQVNTFEVELSNLPLEMRTLVAAMPVPLTPEGDDGFSYSYSGSIAGLMASGK